MSHVNDSQHIKIRTSSMSPQSETRIDSCSEICFLDLRFSKIKSYAYQKRIEFGRSLLIDKFKGGFLYLFETRMTLHFLVWATTSITSFHEITCETGRGFTTGEKTEVK